MRVRVLIGAAAALFLVVALLLGGGAPFGRMALAFGLPKLGASLFADANWRGTAYARGGQMGQAAESFENAGLVSGYNAGTAYALSGDYAKALEVLDTHLLVFPDDLDAQENYELIRTYYAGIRIDLDAEIIGKADREGSTTEAEIGQGNARAASTGSESHNQTSGFELPTLLGRGREGVRQVFDDYFYEANRRWLTSMQDVPGEYLAERIKHEYKRRDAAGIGQPPAEDEE